MLVVMRRWAAAQGDLPERALRDPDFLPSSRCQELWLWLRKLSKLRQNAHFIKKVGMICIFTNCLLDLMSLTLASKRLGKQNVIWIHFVERTRTCPHIREQNMDTDSWAPFMCHTETAWTGMLAALRIGTDPHFVCAAALAPPKPWVHHLVERSSSVGEVRAKTAQSRKAKRTQRLDQVCNHYDSLVEGKIDRYGGKSTRLHQPRELWGSWSMCA